MPTDTAAAMAHLRQSCAIASGNSPRPIPRLPRPDLSDLITGEPIQVTCWEAGGWSPCRDCGKSCSVITDGRKDWISCKNCETVRDLAPEMWPTGDTQRCSYCGADVPVQTDGRVHWAVCTHEAKRT